MLNFATFLIWMDLIMMSEQAPVIISKYQWKGVSKNDVIYDKHTYQIFHEFFWQKLLERVLLCNNLLFCKFWTLPFCKNAVFYINSRFTIIRNNVRQKNVVFQISYNLWTVPWNLKLILYQNYIQLTIFNNFCQKKSWKIW